MIRTSLVEYCSRIADAMMRGKLAVFLGAGVNLTTRPEGFSWQAPQSSYLPNGGELARYLALRFRYPCPDPCPNPRCPRASLDLDLARVAQYSETTTGTMALYDHLRAVFGSRCSPGLVHHFLASVPVLMEGKPPKTRNQLLVTTNYDDLLEQAFVDARSPFDLLSYDAEGDHKGKFWHHQPNQPPRLVDKPNEYGYPFLDVQPVILKIHGTIDRGDANRDSYVITEDHYIDYLARIELSSSIPVTILDRLRNSHLLFLGYSLRDWNLRVILRRLNRSRRLTVKSWAILHSADAAEHQFWIRNDVEIIDYELDEFIDRLREFLENA